MRAGARELFRMRKAQIEAERQALLAQLAQNRARAVLLGLEYKYGLLGTEATIDIHSGVIRSGGPTAVREATGEPR